MDHQQLANLKQLAATLRLSTHILEQYPEQLYNQVVGRIGEVAYIHGVMPPVQPYLRQVSRSLKRPDQAIRRILAGHSNSVNSCVFSPDGKLLVSASEDTTSRLWDVETGDCLRVFQGHTQPVTACAFIPDGRRYVVSASEDATLRLWDCDTGRTIRILNGHTQTINACAFSPDGHYILSASGGNQWQQTGTDNDNSLRLWNVETGQCEHVFVFPEDLRDRICACVFSEDGRLALSVGADGRLHLWNMETRQCIQTCWENSETILSCIFIPDTSQALQASIHGNSLALCTSVDHTLRLWEIGKYRQDISPWPMYSQVMFEDPLEKSLKILNGHQDDVTGCAIIFVEQHPDKVYILSSSHDKTLRIWDLVSGECLHILRGHTGWVNSCAVSQEGRLAASASSDHTVILWDIEAIFTSSSVPGEEADMSESWHCARIFTGQEQNVEGCAFSPDGRYILGVSSWFALQLWDSTSGEVVRSFTHNKWVRCCAFSPDGKYILGGYTEGTLILWDVQTGQAVKTFPGDERDVWGCVFSRDGNRILSSAGYDHTLRYWDVESGECIHTLTGHNDRVTACAISPDGKLGLSASDDWTLRLWNLTTGKCLHILEKERSGDFRGLLQVNDCTFSPDGRYALSASKDQTVSLWSVEDGQLVRTYIGHSAAVQGCTFSPDGRLIASVSTDQSVRLWDVETAACLCTFRGHTDTVYKCAFSPDGQYILSESRDRTLRLWDISSYKDPPRLTAHQQKIRACRFSPDGRYVLSASADHTLRLWDVATQQVQRIFTGHTEDVNDCAFSEDGRYLLSASNDHTLRLWDIRDGTCKKQFIGHNEWVWGCAFSPDGRHILSGAGDRCIAQWEIATGHFTALFTNLTRNWTRYTFTTDGRYVLSTSTKYTLKLWDVVQAKYVPSYGGIIGPPLSEEFQRNCTIFTATVGRNGVSTAVSPNGDFALSVYPDKTFILWEIATGKEIYRRQSPAGMYLNDPPFSPDGKYLLMRTDDNVLRIWNARAGKEIARWMTDANIMCCAFHPDGRQIVVGDESGALHFLVLEGVSIDDGSPQLDPDSDGEESTLVSSITTGKDNSPFNSAPLTGQKQRLRWPFGKHEKRQSKPLDAIPIMLRLKLMRWFTAFTRIPGARRYLENHLELLRDESDQFFTIMMSNADEDSSIAERLRTLRELLHTSHAHGSTKAAVRDAFSDRFEAFISLDVPAWLDTWRKQLRRGLEEPEAIPFFRDAITHAQRDAAVVPEVVASLQVNLAELLQSNEEDEPGEVIALAKSALEVFTNMRFPRQFARTQGALGSAYFSRGSEDRRSIPGEKNRDVQRAIRSFKAALSVLNPEAQPREWSQNHLRLALAYEFEGAIESTQLHLTKVLEVLSSKDDPRLYAMLQEKLDTISMELAATDVKVDFLEQAFDSHMAEMVRNRLYAVRKDRDDNEAEIVYDEIEVDDDSFSDDNDEQR